MRAALLTLLFSAACSPGSVAGSGSAADAGAADAFPVYEDLDKARAAEQFRTTTDLMRFVIAPGCAAETNECHSNEDYPDLSSDGNLWNAIDLPCNLGVGDRTTVEDFCEALGDELRVTSGLNAGFAARIGSIEILSDELSGDFLSYQILVEQAPPQSDEDADFEIIRDGVAIAALGGGGGLSMLGGSTTIQATDTDSLADPDLVRQGDENRNGIFGDGSGRLIRLGDARNSYLVRRLLGAETTRARMPESANSDNPTERNRTLSPDQMYAIMSWINCTESTADIYADIVYDCAANANNEGEW